MFSERGCRKRGLVVRRALTTHPAGGLAPYRCCYSSSRSSSSALERIRSPRSSPGLCVAGHEKARLVRGRWADGIQGLLSILYREEKGQQGNLAPVPRHRSALARALVVGTRGLIGSGKMASALPVVVRVKRKRELSRRWTPSWWRPRRATPRNGGREMRLWRRSSTRPCRERWEIPLTSVKARSRAATDPSARLSRGRGVPTGAGSDASR